MTRILVIDEDPSVCDAIHAMLSSLGYAVTVAASGEAGLVAASGQGFAAALVDLFMQGACGLEAIRTLRAHAPATQVIAMSAQAGVPDFLGMASNLQGIPRLGKPLRREELLGLLEQCRVA